MGNWARTTALHALVEARAGQKPREGDLAAIMPMLVPDSDGGMVQAARSAPHTEEYKNCISLAPAMRVRSSVSCGIAATGPLAANKPS